MVRVVQTRRGMLRVGRDRRRRLRLHQRHPTTSERVHPHPGEGAGEGDGGQGEGVPPEGRGGPHHRFPQVQQSVVVAVVAVGRLLVGVAAGVGGGGGVVEAAVFHVKPHRRGDEDGWGVQLAGSSLATRVPNDAASDSDASSQGHLKTQQNIHCKYIHMYTCTVYRLCEAYAQNQLLSSD